MRVGTIPAPPRGISRPVLWNRALPYLLIGPASLLIAGVLLYPLALSIRISLYAKQLGFPERFVGFQNYVRVASDAVFLNSVQVTTIWTIGSVAGQMLIGIVLALLLHREFPGRGVFRTLLLLPWAIPNFIAALTWVWMFSDRFGIISHLLMQAGIVQEPILFLASPEIALPSIILVNIWKNYAFVMIVILAALQAIPTELYEAARVDGASWWQELWGITMPLIRPMILIVLLLRVIWTFNTFELIFIMTEGGPARQTELLPITAYLWAFRTGLTGLGGALGVILMIATIIFCSIYVRVYGRSLRGEI
ncbi:MAG: sugar ABC transporter permease [Chloroflexota bacterium]